VLPADVQKTGLGFKKASSQPGARVFVKKAELGSWAKEAGFRVGDEIVTLNGQHCIGLTSEDIRNTMQMRPVEFEVLPADMVEYPLPDSKEQDANDKARGLPTDDPNGTPTEAEPPFDIEKMVRRGEAKAGATTKRIVLPADVQKTGLGFKKASSQPGARVFVKKAELGSWAKEAGFRVGDEIVTLNGQHCIGLTSEDIRNTMQMRPVEFEVLPADMVEYPMPGSKEKDAAAARIQTMYRQNKALDKDPQQAVSGDGSSAAAGTNASSPVRDSPSASSPINSGKEGSSIVQQSSRKVSKSSSNRQPSQVRGGAAGKWRGADSPGPASPRRRSVSGRRSMEGKDDPVDQAREARSPRVASPGRRSRSLGSMSRQPHQARGGAADRPTDAQTPRAASPRNGTSGRALAAVVGSSKEPEGQSPRAASPKAASASKLPGVQPRVASPTKGTSVGAMPATDSGILSGAQSPRAASPSKGASRGATAATAGSSTELEGHSPRAASPRQGSRGDALAAAAQSPRAASPSKGSSGGATAAVGSSPRAQSPRAASPSRGGSSGLTALAASSRQPGVGVGQSTSDQDTSALARMLHSGEAKFGAVTKQIHAGDDIIETGLGLKRCGARILVQSMTPGTWAQKAGFSKDDEIILLNDLRCDQLSGEDLSKQMRQRPLRFTVLPADMVLLPPPPRAGDLGPETSTMFRGSSVLKVQGRLSTDGYSAVSSIKMTKSKTPTEVAADTQADAEAAASATPDSALKLDAAATLRRMVEAGEAKPGAVIKHIVCGFDISRTGLFCKKKSTHPEARVFVKKADKGTWAQKAGFQVGDEIIMMNGEPCTCLSSEDLREALQKRPIHFVLLPEVMVKHPPPTEDQQDVAARRIQSEFRKTKSNKSVRSAKSTKTVPVRRREDTSTGLGTRGRYAEQPDFEEPPTITDSAVSAPRSVTFGTRVSRRLDFREAFDEEDDKIVKTATSKTAVTNRSVASTRSDLSPLTSAKNAAATLKRMIESGEALPDAVPVEIIADDSVQETGLRFKQASVEAHSRVFVERKTPGSWADRAGFNAGDEIVLMNGLRCKSMSSDALDEEVEKRPLHMMLLPATMVAFPPHDQQEDAPSSERDADADAERTGDRSEGWDGEGVDGRMLYIVVPADVDKLGLSVTAEPPFPVFVKELKPGTWAEKSGLQVGDEILAIDGKKCKDIDQKTFRALLRQRPLRLLVSPKDDLSELGIDDSTEDEVEHTFCITLDRRNGEALGLAIEPHGDRLCILEVKEGLVADWNETSSKYQVCDGDFIMQVNRKHANADAESEELKEKKILHLKILQAEKNRTKRPRSKTRGSWDVTMSEEALVQLNKVDAAVLKEALVDAQHQIGDMEIEADQLREEIRKLRANLAKKDRELVQQKERINALEDELEAKTARIHELEQDMNTTRHVLTKEMEMLRRTAEEEQVMEKKRSDQLSKRLEDLQVQHAIESAQAKADAAAYKHQTDARIASLEDDLSSRNQEAERLRAELQRVSEEDVMVRQHSHALEEQLATKDAQLSDVLKEHSALNADVRDKLEKLKFFTDENSALKRELEEAKAEMARLQFNHGLKQAIDAPLDQQLNGEGGTLADSLREHVHAQLLELADPEILWAELLKVRSKLADTVKENEALTEEVLRQAVRATTGEAQARHHQAKAQAAEAELHALTKETPSFPPVCAYDLKGEGGVVRRIVQVRAWATTKENETEAFSSLVAPAPGGLGAVVHLARGGQNLGGELGEHPLAGQRLRPPAGSEQAMLPSPWPSMAPRPPLLPVAAANGEDVHMLSMFAPVIVPGKNRMDLPDAPVRLVQPFDETAIDGLWEWKYQPADGPWTLSRNWGLLDGILTFELERPAERPPAAPAAPPKDAAEKQPERARGGQPRAATVGQKMPGNARVRQADSPPTKTVHSVDAESSRRGKWAKRPFSLGLPQLGDRVSVSEKVLAQVLSPQDRFGVVKFIGETAFSSGLWIGVALDKGVGKNNGVVNGVRYFDCEHEHGLFVRPKLVLPVDVAVLLDAISFFLDQHGLRLLDVYREYASTYTKKEDDNLTAKELSELLLRSGFILTEESCALVIHFLDKDRNGRLNILELANALRERRRGKKRWTEPNLPIVYGGGTDGRDASPPRIGGLSSDGEDICTSTPGKRRPNNVEWVDHRGHAHVFTAKVPFEARAGDSRRVN